MRNWQKLVVLGGVAVAALAARAWGEGSGTSTGWQQQVEAILRSEGQVQDGALRFSLEFPLDVNLFGEDTKRPLATDGFVAFKDEGSTFLVVLEMPVEEEPSTTLVKELDRLGFTVNAEHNHLIVETPRVIFLHATETRADVTVLAQRVRTLTVQSRLKVTPGPTPVSASNPVPGLDWHHLAQILGADPRAEEGVLAFTFPRPEHVTFQGLDLPPPMGPQSEVRFQALGPDDFAMVVVEAAVLPEEVQPFIHALRSHHIEVTAVHDHFLFEEPRLFYVHGLALGQADALAKAVRDALDRTNHR